MQKMSVDQKDWEVKFSAEKSTLETEIRILKNKLKDAETKIARLMDENKKIDELSQQRMKEIERWKQDNSNA